jgi:hypothetical protein
MLLSLRVFPFHCHLSPNFMGTNESTTNKRGKTKQSLPPEYADCNYFSSIEIAASLGSSQRQKKVTINN